MQTKGTMKKLVATLLSTITVCSGVLGMVACGNGNTDNSSSSAPAINNSQVVNGNVDVVAYDGSEVTVTFYHTMGATLRAVLDKYIPKFNALYPNITIAHATQGDYPGVLEQISTELMADKAPSIAFCYPDHVAQYNNAKVVLPLDAWIESDLTVTNAKGETEQVGYTQAQLDDFVPAYYNEGTVYGDGVMYTLPFAKSSEVLYYNKTAFTQRGWEVPTTWDEMEALCKRMIEEENNSKLIPLGYDSEANWFITMTEQLKTPYTSAKKGEYYLFNNEKNWEFVKRFTDWYYEGYVITEETNGGSYSSDLFKRTDHTKTYTYMSIGSSAGASYQCPLKISDGVYPFEVGVAMIPQADATNKKVISQGPSLCLFKKANPQEMAAAWLFTKFLTSNVELQADYSIASGYTCAIQSVEQDPYYVQFLDTANGNSNLQASCVKLTTSQEYKDAFFISPAFNGSSTAREQVGLMVTNCLLNCAGKENTMDLIKAEFDKALKKCEYLDNN